MSPAALYWRMFHRVARSRLYRVRVHFESIPLADLDRHSDGEYGALELEVLGLEDLRKTGLDPRSYYQLRNRCFDEMEAIEAATLAR